jgi:signal transduction histidine kinase
MNRPSFPGRRRSLAFRLLLLSGAAAILPALGVMVVLRSISSRALQGAIERHQTELARRVANEVNGEIRYARGLIAFTVHSEALSRGVLLEQQQALRGLLRAVPALQEAMLVGPDGMEQVKVVRQGTPGSLIKRTARFEEAFIGPPFFSGKRLPSILISEPLLSHPWSLRPGALVAKMSFSSLGSLMQQTQIDLQGNAYIVDPHGTLLAHPDAERVRAHANFSKIPVVQDWLSHPLQATGLDAYVDEGGVRAVALAYPIPFLKSAVVVQQPESVVYAPLVRMRNQFILWTLLWVSLFMGLTIAIAWRILQPLRQLQGAAEQIGRGQMDVRLDIHTRDELEDLATAFARMAESLRQLETMRRDLINMIVHDLKAPLSSILASLDYLLTGELGPLDPNQRKFLAMGYRSGHDLMMLIQNLLDVAKMEEGKMILRREPFVPLRWAENVIAPFRLLASAAKKELRLESSADIPSVEGDAALLGRVLSNLLSNALYHAQPGSGEVIVSLACQGNHLAVAVRDNGPGIPPEDQARIFEKFVQIESRSAYLRSGTGLGLSFCKMVVEAHGGRITVQSAPQEGSTFTFYLPLVIDAGRTVPEPTLDRTVAAASTN